MDPNSSAFRRTQLLQYPRGQASTSTANGFLARKSSRHVGRSKSSKYRTGSAGDSALGRLSGGQRVALITSWRVLKIQVVPLMRKIFQELEIAAPKVKDIFYKAVVVDCFVQRDISSNAIMDEHVKYMTKFFDDLIANIDCESETMEMIKKVGQHHAILGQSCGFEAIIWEQLSEIAMEKICSTNAVQKTRNAGRAWRTLIAFITDQLRCGYDRESRNFSRRSSVDHLNGPPCANNKELIKSFQRLRMDYNKRMPFE